MKNYIYLFAIMTNLLIFGQRNEFGLQIGSTNLTGDIGRTNYLYILPDKLYNNEIPFHAALFYQMNFNPYQSVRVSGAYNHISFNDAYAREDYRKQRGLSGTNELYELSATFNYYFLPINEEQKAMISPYIFGGFTAFNYSTPSFNIRHDFKRLADGTAVAPTNSDDFTSNITTADNVNKFGFGIPFGIGLKYKFNYNFSAFLEAKFRPTFSDDIDFSHPDSKNIKVGYNTDLLDINNPNNSLLQSSPFIEVANLRNKQLSEVGFGNPNSKDWLNTVSVGLSYSYGRPPCYCK